MREKVYGRGKVYMAIALTGAPFLFFLGLVIWDHL